MAEHVDHKLKKDYHLPGGVVFKKGQTISVLPGAKEVAYQKSGHIAKPRKKKETSEPQEEAAE